MVVLISLFLFLFIGIILVSFSKFGLARGMALYGIVLILFSLLGIGAKCFRIISPGQVGVPVLFGKVQENVLHSGMHFVNPLIEIVPLSVRTEAYTMSRKHHEGRVKGDDAISVLTNDGLQIKMDVTVWFHLDPAKATYVYNTIGVDYIDKIVRPAVRTAIRDVSVRFSVTDIYSDKRKEVVNMISEILTQELQERGIVFEKMLLRNVMLPERVRRAIDEKIAAEQEAQKMEYVLQKEKKEAERKQIEAEGIAKAQKIIANSLTQKYLSWYYIQTMKGLMNSPNNTIIITPFDQTLVPLLNTNSTTK